MDIGFLKIKFSVSLLIGAVALICVSQSCTERETAVGNQDLSEKAAAARELAENLPGLRFIDSSKGNARSSGSAKPGAFDFADTPDGISFSSSADIAFERTADGGVIVVDVRSLTEGGGTVVAGSETYQIDVAFCFSAEDDPFDLNEEFETGISGVIGLVGAEDVASIEDVTSFEHQLEAIVYYVVFEDNAEGAYKVVSAEDEAHAYKKAMALIIDVKEENYFVSSRGRLTVTSNAMTFEGHYYELLMEGDATYTREVSGSGTVSCF